MLVDIPALVKANAAIPVKEGEGLKVINAGLPKTGTMSLYVALGMLGFRTFHMIEIVSDVEKSRLWTKIIKGNTQPDWREVYKGTPLRWTRQDYYLELSQAFPDAKVIISTRDPDKWWYSMRTIMIEPHIASPYYRAAAWWFKIWWEQLHVADALIERWQKRYGEIGPGLVQKRMSEVQKNIPKERLLVFRVQEGWEPLCKFLNVPVPNEPFPNVNDGPSLKALFQTITYTGMAMWGGVIATTLGIAIGGLYSYPEVWRPWLGH